MSDNRLDEKSTIDDFVRIELDEEHAPDRLHEITPELDSLMLDAASAIAIKLNDDGRFHCVFCPTSSVLVVFICAGPSPTDLEQVQQAAQWVTKTVKGNREPSNPVKALLFLYWMTPKLIGFDMKQRVQDKALTKLIMGSIKSTMETSTVQNISKRSSDLN